MEQLQEVERVDEFEVDIRVLDSRRLAYIRVPDSYRRWQDVVAAHDGLGDWFRARGEMVEDMELFGMSYDEPEFTDLEKCAFEWAVTVPENPHWSEGDGVSMRRQPKCRVAMVRTAGDVALLDRARQYLWRYWLPRSGFDPDDIPAMEIYNTPPVVSGWERYDMWCGVPVRGAWTTDSFQ